MSLLLIRYSEIALKSPRVRSRFQKRMINNIEDAFIRNKLDCTIDYDWGRIYIYPDNQNKAIELLQYIFGIVSISPVEETISDPNVICEAAVEYSKPLLKKGNSFAIRARRTGEHDFTSMDVAKRAGAAVLDANSTKSVSVNLTKPDVKIFIEVRHNKCFIFSEKIPGPGGLPLGTQGRAIGLLNGDKSLIAMWLMMKRGCKILPVYFDNGDESAKTASEQRLAKLRKWDAQLKLRFIAGDGVRQTADFEQNGYNNSEYLAAENRAFRLKADAIVSGETFEQLTRKTGFGEKVTKLPIFYPLVGMDNNNLTELSAKIFE